MAKSFRSLATDYADNNDKNVFIVGIAIILSVLIHTGIAFFAKSAPVDLFAPSYARNRAQVARPLPMRVKLAEPNRSALEQQTADAEQSPLEERDRASDEAMDPVKLLEADRSSDVNTTIFEPPALANVTESSLYHGITPPESVVVQETLTPWVPREEILEIGSRFANDDLATLQRNEMPDIERVFHAADITPSGTASLSVSLEALSKQSLSNIMPAGPSPSELETPAFVSAASEKEPPPQLVDPNETEEKISEYVAEIPEEKKPATPIEAVLLPTIQTYRPARDDGFIYFRLDIRRKGADVLPVIPRDVMIVQDASASVSLQRIFQCRNAISTILKDHLQPSDRINLLAFNTTNSYAFGKTWMPATPENIGKALRFTEQIRAGGNTDIFNAIQSVLEMPRDPARATLVFLLTDGVVTAGELKRDSEIIGEFSRLNAGRFSVFNLGISPKSDRYLLSMLSFCNRGGSAVLSPDRFRIPETFVSLYEKTRSPVLTDIQITFDSFSQAIMTPLTANNLYLDRPISLWGRVPADMENLYFRATGANRGKSYDMVYTLQLGSPALGSGDAEIAADWARSRMYDLVAIYSKTRNVQCLREMKDISDRYDIPLPFGRRFNYSH